MAAKKPKVENLLGLFEGGRGEAIDFKLESFQLRTMAGALFGIGVVDLLATVFLLIITYVTTTREGMKKSDKVLVYNMLIPDFVMAIIILNYLAPATLAGSWTLSRKDTIMMGFLHTLCLFHPHIAVASICYVIAVSLSDAYVYEMSNDMKHMLVVLACSISVTICFCSLPVVEDEGYSFKYNWLGPSFDISSGYGDMFMCAGLLGIICYSNFNSLMTLTESRRFFQAHSARVNQRALEDLDQNLLFCVSALAGACFLFPVMIGIPDPTLMVFPRLILYTLPLLRVIFVLKLCPHFQFAFFGKEDDVDDFAAIGGDEDSVDRAASTTTVSGKHSGSGEGDAHRVGTAL